MKRKTSGKPVQNPQKYATAKIILVGEAGVGKTDLALRVATGNISQTTPRGELQSWVIQDFGAQPNDEKICETVLWDLPSRPDYRLVHPLLLADVDLALIVVDPTRIRESHHYIEFWMDQLMHGRSEQCPAILVGARIERGSSMLTEEQLSQLCSKYNISGGYMATSAHMGDGIPALMQKISSLINWDALTTSISETFNDIRKYILSIKEENDPGKTLITFETLQQNMKEHFNGREFDLDIIHSTVHQLEIHGHLRVLADSKGSECILLLPNLLINLATSFVYEARRNEKGLGALEERLLRNEYSFTELADVSKDDAKILVDSTVSLFIGRNLCFRESSNNKTYLVFPTLIEEKKPKFVDFDIFDGVSYKITGPVENAYATLVVLLGYTSSFVRTNQWQDQAQYELDEGEICGFRQISKRDGESNLVLYYARETPEHAQSLFQGYFEKFLKRRPVTIIRYRPVICSNIKCKEPLDRDTIINSTDRNHDSIYCHYCGTLNQLFGVKEMIPSQLDKKALPEPPDELEELRTKFESALTRVKRIRDDLDQTTKPKCFISYAWGVSENERWVLQLAKDLRNADIEVLLDRWDSPPGSNLDIYIDRILSSDFVIPIGTPELRKKYDTKKADPVVAAELKLINVRVRQPNEYGDTVLPVLLTGNAKTSFTPQLQPLVSVDFREAEYYFRKLFDMIWRLYDLPFDNPLLEELQASMTPPRRS
jgi:GTPase SAR1 family protein